MATRDKNDVGRPLPLLCRNYNKKCGCSRESCEDLHMCYYFLCRHCTNKDCTRSHTLGTPRNIVILEERGFSCPEDIEVAFVGMQRKMRGVTLMVCFAYNADMCEAADCQRLHVCHRHVLDGCPLEDCDLSHSVTTGQHNLRILKLGGQADEPEANLIRQLAEELTEHPFWPAICKRFYNRTGGCEGRCLRLHCCPFYARGNCWYDDRCFKRHSLQDLRNQEVLRFFGCTESQALAIHASRRCDSADGEGGGHENDEDSSPETGTDGDRSGRPAEVQRLINYLEQYRQQKVQRDHLRKERQQRLQLVLKRKEEEDREVQGIRRELQGKEQQEGERKEGKGNPSEIEDNLQQTAAAHSQLSEFKSREQQLELKVKNLSEEHERSTRDLARFRELIRRQREYIKCGVCRGVLKQPVILSCSHTFCKACIESTKRLTEACPFCFQPIFAELRCSVLDKLVGSIIDIGER